MTPIEKLSHTNFLSVCDIALDVKEKLQLSEESVVLIPFLRKIIRPNPFNILMPGDDIDSAEQYCDYRLEAIKYLKENNYIDDFESFDETDYMFNRNVEITLNRKVFDKFYDKLEKIYQRRVVDPAIKEREEKAENKIVEFNPLFSLKFDGRAISTSSIEKLNTHKSDDEFNLSVDEIKQVENKVLEIISSPKNIGKIYEINDFEKLCDSSNIRRRCYYILPSLVIEKIYRFLFKTDFRLAIYFEEKEDSKMFSTKEKKTGILYVVFPSYFDSIIKKIINNEWLENSDADLFIKEKGFNSLPQGAFNIKIKILSKKEDNIGKIEKTQNKKRKIKIKTKFGFLFINKKTGTVKFGKVQTEFNPTSEEFKTLLKIITAENYIATYEYLLENNVTKDKKRNLSFVVRDIKKTLGILPKKKPKNKDCIKNVKRYGYKLIT